MATQNIFDLTDTWNNVATTFTAIKMNATDTASAAGSLLIDLQVGGVSQFKVSKAGAITAVGGANFTGQLIGGGTATNDSAAAGRIGEFTEAEVTTSGALSLTSVTNLDVCTLALTAGDWDVWGTLYFLPVGATIVNQQGWIGTAAGTNPGDVAKGAYILNTNVGTGQWVAPVGQRRISLAASGSVYLTARSNFSVGTTTVAGYIAARRVR